MAKIKNTFADTAIHGPHAKLPPEVRKARREWLAASYAREQQLAELHEEGLSGYADTGRGTRALYRGAPAELQVRRKD